MAKNPNLIYIPNFSYYEVKNPKRLFPTNWEEVYGEENVRYDDEPIFDENGNYLGTKKNIYVTMKQLKGFKIIRKNKPVKSNAKKLFETYSDKTKKNNQGGNEDYE